MTIDGDSPVQTTRADPPLSAGFQSAPQALMPRMEVGVGEDVFADTRRAVSVLVGLQRMSALPIDTAVDAAATGHRLAEPGRAHLRRRLVGSADHVARQCKRSGELKVAGIDGPTDETTLTLDPGQRFGSLQVVLDGQRTLLIATSNGAPAQLDGLLAWLDSTRCRWSRLTGTAVLAPRGGDPVMIGADEPQQPVLSARTVTACRTGGSESASSRWSPLAPG